MSIHILRVPTEEIYRESYGEHWCFVCRKRREFTHTVHAPIVEPPKPGEEDTYEFPTAAYYGPHHTIQCETCGTVDGDCFPGTGREWSDE